MKQFLITMSLVVFSQSALAEVHYQIDTTKISQNSLRRYDLKGAAQWISRGGRLGVFKEEKNADAPNDSATREVKEGDLKADSEKHLQESTTTVRTLGGNLPQKADAGVAAPETMTPIRYQPQEFQYCRQKVMGALSAQSGTSVQDQKLLGALETLVARASRASGIPCGEYMGLGRFDAVPTQHLLRYFWILQKDTENAEQWTELFFLSFGQDSPEGSRQSFRKLWSGLSTRWILYGQSWGWENAEWLSLLTQQKVDAASVQEALANGHAAFALKRGVK